VAIPAISTGAYGFPPDRAAAIAVRETREFLKRDSFVQRVALVCYDHDTKRAFERAMQDASDDRDTRDARAARDDRPASV
jgi:O-acetyl-ADP-ribose deacetylase (regulator of RNase III)